MTRLHNLRFRIRSDRAVACAVTLAPLLYFLPALLQGRVLCPDDGLLQNVPFRVAAAQMIRSGHLPFWDPYIFSGMPLLATAQVGIFYPLNWVYVVFSTTAATNLMVLATYMVAALGAYLYARRIGASIAGAALTSLAFQFGGATIGQISHINIVQTAAVMPWVLWSIERYAGSGTIKRGAVVPLFIALQFFAGHQQAFVNSFLLVTVYVAMMAIAHRDLRKRYLTALAFMAMGLLLAAVQILPTFELLRRSERSAATYEFFTSFSMPRRFILAFVAPYIVGGGDGRLFRAPYAGPPFYPEMVGYVGVLTLMLAVIAVVARPDFRAKFWAFVAVVCLLLALGAYAPLGLYRLIYYLPVLNLFRVPARHLMEVDFALAVLAGRSLTVLGTHRSNLRAQIIAPLAAIGILLFTIFSISVLRPAEFHLARAIPVTILRTPELFMPLLVATLSAYLLWRYTRGRRGTKLLMFVLLIFDLCVWGQSSGWFVESPHASDDYFHQPETVRALAQIAPADSSSYRILTAPHYFDPAVPPVPPSVSHSTDVVLWTQPDVYMMYGIQNAAGYDGFGLERYGELAGRMKVWGELTDPDTTLRGDSREIDLVNVRYLLSMRKQSNSGISSAAFATADQKFGDYLFAANDLGLSSLPSGKHLSFSVPQVQADHIGLVTHLAWSENVPDDTVVAQLRVHLAGGKTLEFPLRAGTDTSEWSYDRPDIRARIRHRKAPVATSYKVEDPSGSYDAHTFVTVIPLAETANVTGGEVLIARDPRWPDLSLSIFRISLINQQENKTYALTRGMVTTENEAEQPKPESSTARWKLLTQTPSVDIYENGRLMPRAWLTSETRVLDESAMLEVIRSGRFADGSNWDPAATALIEGPLSNDVSHSQGSAQIIRYEPNRIDVRTKAEGPSVLVLGENHYPGWRTYVDGRAVDTLRVDYNLRGAVLPAGEHLVEFSYQPKSVMIGAVISLLALMLLVSGIVIESRR